MRAGYTSSCSIAQVNKERLTVVGASRSTTAESEHSQPIGIAQKQMQSIGKDIVFARGKVH